MLKLIWKKEKELSYFKKYNVKAFPTYLFIDGNGEAVHRTLGYVEEKRLYPVLQKTRKIPTKD